jgi:branched-chain amino acid transport system permease protein
MGKQLSILAVIGVAFAALPLFTSSGSLINSATMILYLALMGQAWNILGGFGGQFSFGHAVFFGTGAYAMAVLQVKFGLNAWAALPLAVALSAIVGTGLGALSFRYGLKGSYFALVTLAFAEVFRILANTFEFTGAGVGLQLPLKESIADMQFATKAGYMWLVLGFTLLAFACAIFLKHSRYGAWLMAVRDNEDAAQALGVNPFIVKLKAITLSGAIMGAGGAFYVQNFRYIDPGLSFGPSVSVEALLVAIVGGMGTIWGPLVGALVLDILGHLTRNLFENAAGLSLVVYGVVLVLMVMFAPRGLAGLWKGIK